ncbi:MAG: ABC transporter substrate-binding protein [Novosphingobium sp.]|jgi:iron complex transport system substrate-binding protein|nr:ABC transporter substrate-binding protein [Novosphingobium sp.]
MPFLRTPLAGLAAALALAGAGAPAAIAAPPGKVEPPRRIVSLNLCTDQLVLALADRSQIAGLTRNATNAEMSAEAARARGLRILGSSAEEILAIAPDLVVGAPTGGDLMHILARRHYRLLHVTATERLEDIFAAIRQTAAAIGHPARGEALIARMRRNLARIPRTGGGKVAAYYQRRGYLTGNGTLVDDLMRRLGLVNLAGRLGKPVLSQVGLEEMVAARPDYIIVESATDRITDQGTEMLHHPALGNIPRISIPQAWTVCGGPAYVDAARSIAARIARHERRKAIPSEPDRP